MPKNHELAAWLDLAEYATELSDNVLDQPAKRTMLRIAKLCETFAFRHPDSYASSPGNEDQPPISDLSIGDAALASQRGGC